MFTMLGELDIPGKKRKEIPILRKFAAGAIPTVVSGWAI
jgi:hypothetical protein